MTPPQPRRVGRYVIIDRLGQGGMGVVYRAWDPELQRTIALKMLAVGRETPPHPDLLERFAREARSAASLTHPHIVTVYDVGQHAGSPYITMECLDGESMAALVLRNDPMPLEQKLRLATELCEGLAFAHHHGVIHRDVKPANVMVTSEGVVKILDFGLARLAGDAAPAGLTEVGAVMGTLHYMSPEQFSGRTADERSDIFAVGAVLYELFTGRRAFSAETTSHLLTQVLHEAPPAMRDVVGAVPPALEALVARCLEKAPERRFQRLDDVVVELRDVAATASGHGAGDPARLTVNPTAGSVAAPGTPDSVFNAAMRNWEAMVADALAPSIQEGPSTASSSATPPAASAALSGPPPENTVVIRPPLATPARRVPVRSWMVEAIAILVALLAVVAYFVFSGMGDDARETPSVVAPAVSAPPASVAAPAGADSTPPVTAQPAPPSSSAPTERSASAPAPAPVGGADAPAVASDRVAPPVVGGERGRAAGPSPQSAGCDDLLMRASLGERLSASERDTLARQCREGGR